MTKYLLDTNICIYIMNRHPKDIIDKFRRFDIGEIGVSTITVSELQYGVAKSKNQALNAKRVEEFLAPLEIISYDEIAANIYGKIRHILEKSGQPIGPLDLLIAAHALGRKLILITNNEKEFKRIKYLNVENWAK